MQRDQLGDGEVLPVGEETLRGGLREPSHPPDPAARSPRLVHKIVWVNPLKGSPHYEPLARGMAAALPSIDEFLPGHNLESLEELSRALAD